MSREGARIGLVTAKEFKTVATEEESLAALLREQGFRAERPAWDDAGVQWKDFDVLVIRSTWDYSYRYEEFFRWLHHIEALNLPVWNPPDVLRWNASKKYLIELAEHGVKIPTTEWLYETEPDFDAVLTDLKWDRAVVKPVFGGGGKDTYAISRDRARSWAAQKPKSKKPSPRRGGWMVQEFVPEIVQDGEWSLLFFNREFSHAAVKKPKSGEFRVQIQHGGTYHAAIADAKIVAQAKRILDYVDSPLLYGRVDGIVRGEEFILMELEIFEPWFFLEYGEGSAERFVNALKEKLT